MSFKGPLADKYPSAVVLVVSALVPYLVLSTAITPLSKIIAADVGLGTQGFQLTSGMANAAYAFGTVLAVQLSAHLPGRRLLVFYALMFTLGSVLAAAAWTPGLFVAGRVMQGLCTSLMLIAAVPPLVTGWPSSRLPYTAATMNMCVFGAVALGPVIGGVQAGSGHWRPLFWIVAGIGGLATLFTLLTYEDTPPQDRSAPWDLVSQLLAGVGSAAAFFGASELATHRLVSVIVMVPLLTGLAMIVLLVVHQYAVENPLMPVRSLTTTFPVAGIITAMCAGAASVAIIELAQMSFMMRASPVHLGMLFWPEFGAAVFTAFAFGLAFRTRAVPLFAFIGLIMLAGGAAVMTGLASGSGAIVVVGSGLVGLGVGGSVAPALFTAGFSLKSTDLQRVFALVELLRGAAAFIAAPILLHMAVTVGGNPAAGTRTAIWVCLGIAAGGALVAGYLFVLGRARLQKPDLDGWLAGDNPAIVSPPIAAGIRGDDPLPRRGGPSPVAD